MGQDNNKQLIVLRTDLGMRKGKMAAQAAHASMKVFFDHILDEPELTNDGDSVGFKIFMPTHGQAVLEWVEGSFTKIAVGVDGEQGLIDIYTSALQKGLPAALIVDSGRTEFHNVPTKTCCAIGPAPSSLIDEITASLKLL